MSYKIKVSCSLLYDIFVKKPPIIDNIQSLAKTKCFYLEQINLTFSNGKRCVYERLKGSDTGAVLVVPMLDSKTVLMIYEYCVGTEKYELGLPKGKIDAGETPLEAANRELQEEVGYGAKQLTLLKTTTLAPGYQSNFTHLVLAQDLYPKHLVGDEPEPLVVVQKSLDDLDELAYHKDLSEGRSIAALYLAKHHLNR